jgi:transcriptional regulator with XRE-family HTH domain
MEVNSAGSYLSRSRKKRGNSLADVSSRIGRRSISKQSLSLIERGRLRIPAARVAALKKAYRLSPMERDEFEVLYAFEKLVAHTGEEREFGEAVLSVIDPRRAGSIYVIGGRRLSLTSPILQEKAAEFLQRGQNCLIFIYPESGGLSSPHHSIWFSNSREDMLEMQESIQAFSKRPIKQQIQFYAIDPRKTGNDPLLLDVFSLCSPFTAITIAGSAPPRHVAGYVYVEGSKERWVLLTNEHARRVLATVTRLLTRASELGGIAQQKLY